MNSRWYVGLLYWQFHILLYMLEHGLKLHHPWLEVDSATMMKFDSLLDEYLRHLCWNIWLLHEFSSMNRFWVCDIEVGFHSFFSIIIWEFMQKCWTTLLKWFHSQLCWMLSVHNWWNWTLSWIITCIDFDAGVMDYYIKSLISHQDFIYFWHKRCTCMQKYWTVWFYLCFERVSV